MADQIRKKRIFYINSGNQLSATSNSFSVQLNNLSTEEDYDYVTVLQVSMPVTYFLVQNGENTFQLKEGATAVTITIPQGNYNQQSFSVRLAALLTAASPNTLTYSITYNNVFTQEQNGWYYYSVNSSSYAISFIFNSNNSVNEQFGFDKGTTASFTAGSGVSTLTSMNVCQFIPENALYIRSNLSQGDYSDVLQDVYNSNSASFGIISWINPCPLEYSKKFIGNGTKVATFQIVDENGLPIYCNGANMSITLMIYKSNTFYDSAMAFMKHLLVEMSSRIMAPAPDEVEKV
jgi:hypothetical protein